MEGTYFRSDEHMAHYEVTNSVGSFVASDIEGDSSNGQDTKKTDTGKQDSTSITVPVRQAATRHASTQKNTMNTVTP
jgi:hypothetical protein